jgi:hypothetical protein
MMVGFFMSLSGEREDSGNEDDDDEGVDDFFFQNSMGEPQYKNRSANHHT